MRQSLDLMIRVNPKEGSANLAELRLILEPEIAGPGCRRIEEQLVSTHEGSSGRDGPQPARSRRVRGSGPRFPSSASGSGGKPLILSLLDSIVGLLREQRSRIFNVDGGPERGQFHHKRIWRAIEQQDPEAAREAMRAHLTTGACGFVSLGKKSFALPANS